MVSRLFNGSGFLQGFVVAALSSLVWPILPAVGWILPLLLILGVAWYWRCGAAVGALMALIWLVLFFNLQLAWLQQLGAPGAKHTIDGDVMAWQPQGQGGVLRLRVRQLDQRPLWPRPLVRLFVSTMAEPPSEGQQLRLNARLKPIHGLGNPSGFNSERWLLGNGVTATGSARGWLALGPPPPPGWRERWVSLAREQVQSLPQSPLLMALVFGEQQAVSKEQWQQLRDGGIIHLIAISGLHIGLAAWLGHLAGRLLSLVPGCRRFGNYLPDGSALGVALLYSALAGFALPTQRALLMLAIWLLGRWWRRRWSLWQIWWASLVVLLLHDGWALFSAGFWLSYLAVALLGISGLLWQRASLWRLQLLMTAGLLPLQLSLFAGVGLLSIPINLLAIPLFGVVLIPLGLLSGLLVPLWPQGAFLGWWVCDRLLGHLMAVLAWLSRVCDSWVWLSASTAWLLNLLILALLAWRFPLGRGVTLCALLGGLLLFVQPTPVWEVQVIDVGQGLSVLVRQGERGLLYDTGDAFPSGYNLADAAILPLLREEGVRQLDYLIISHSDRDHASNWQTIKNGMPVRQLISSAPLSAATRPCRRGLSWRWLELRLQFLAPESEVSGQENRDSCVLRIDDGEHSLLLVGDLPDSEERRLLATPDLLRPVAWLVSGHHGSRHSSSQPFIQALAPREVVHSAGYANRWNFPDPQVKARFFRQGVRQWSTADQGLIRIRIWPDRTQIDSFRTRGSWYRHLDAWLRGE
ncbi:MAG: DNA internalization-related competence protein ComEC/Rec2 [Aeromonadaceae bacterium]|nr:DNA internalization-related competence protein ComEC/Rec2 [Aeromonadaceae bacterium]MBP8064981.1 DNA internalization-related competence protein ComEC/Rec2 [Aeromonadaceae bacterium]